ncbi:MAG: hypothetical protein ACP5N6_10500 [Anaerolineae bacterium]
MRVLHRAGRILAGQPSWALRAERRPLGAWPLGASPFGAWPSADAPGSAKADIVIAPRAEWFVNSTFVGLCALQ